jgi:hypothetical protein
MFYKLLGMLVWKLAKSYLRQRYGSVMAPKSLLVGGLALALAAIALAARQLSGDE